MRERDQEEIGSLVLLVVISGAVVVASPSAAGTCCGTASDSRGKQKKTYKIRQYIVYSY